MAAHHAGHGDQADILAERRVGQGTEQAGNGRADPVGECGALDFLVGGFTPGAALGDARYVAHGFHRRHERHQAEADDRRDREFHAEMQRVGQGKAGRAAHAAKAHHAHEEGHDIAGDQPQQHSRNRQHPARIEFQAQRHHDDHRGHEPVLQRAIFRLADGGYAPGGILDAHLDQRETDHHHHKPCHQRRQCKADATDEKAQSGVEQATHQNAAHQNGNGIHTLARDQRDHDRNEGKAGALHDGQARAHRADADGLDQGRQPGKEHRHLDHIDHLWKIGRVRSKTEPGRAADDDRRGDVRDKHCQHVLDAQRNGLGQWRRIIGVSELVCCPYGSVSHTRFSL